MGRIVLDLTRLARYGLPRRHVIFAMSERKPAYPAHTQDTHEDEDEGPFAQPDKSVVSDGGDDQPLVQPASRREPAEERRDPATHNGDLATLVPPKTTSSCTSAKKKRTSSLARPICHTRTRGVRGLA